mmetsp:Transcript_8889/g.7872  ORF Transcript_8889/g.7872 Transcript_8889/m.7872 type:complete len:127 (-) Transcript_8889:1271-1651(-)
MTFKILPLHVFLTFIEILLFYAVASYINCKNLEKEFLANSKAQESSTEFKQFLKSLPEGVSIIDDDSEEIKFINLKLKETFNVKLFLEAKEGQQKLDDIETEINKDFDKVLNNSVNKLGQESKDFL